MTKKFRSVDPVRPISRGRPPKHYHPLLRKEKDLETLVRRILPTEIADSVRPSGSRLAHLYGLPKTHKEKLAMRPILSATQTYNYALAKWLDDKLKPLAINHYTITDTCEFVNEVNALTLNDGDVLVSYDVSSLFTNVPLDETIHILADKAFANDWFNETHHLNLSKQDLVDLLEGATKDQLFLFNGQIYMNRPTGSPWAPRLGPYSPMSLCAALKKPWIAKERCPATTGGMWMTHLPSCLTKHQPTTFWRLLTNVTPRSSLPWRLKIIVCFRFSEHNCSTNLPTLRQRYM